MLTVDQILNRNKEAIIHLLTLPIEAVGSMAKVLARHLRYMAILLRINQVLEIHLTKRILKTNITRDRRE